MPHLTIGAVTPEAADISFLKEMDLEDILEKNTILEWSYARRRQAQMILPWLYLGPIASAKDVTFIQREGISMVLAVRVKKSSLVGALQAASGMGLQAAAVEAPTFHDLIPQFHNTTNIINQHVAAFKQHSLQASGGAKLGKVLVFCESGNEKSAAVVAAYLMETLENIDFIKAMQVVQAQRFCVNFDDSIKNILQSYGDILGAQRSVASSYQQTALFNTSNGTQNHLRVPQGQTISSSKPKRTIEDTYDEDETMKDAPAVEADALRFAGRDNTPFRD